MKKIDRTLCPTKLPIYQTGQNIQAHYSLEEKTAEALKRAGVTHVKINQALCSIPRVMDPLNMYLQFMEAGYPMNQFVSTSYDKDIYYAKMLELNQISLKAHAKFAHKYGFRCYLWCIEPTFLQETLLNRYPNWRGPRVDNPSCSIKPIYAPCVLLPEVQDYYKQQVQTLLKQVPTIDEIHIFTNDTGAGFCRSELLYAGASGPVHCKKTSPGKHAQEFCKVLFNAGHELNPEFRVVMTSGLSASEKTDFIKDAPEGVYSSIYGAFAWMGGLEDIWGTMAIGPRVFNNPEERKKIRDWQHADMCAKALSLTKNQKAIYASYDPCYYRSDVPRPGETYRIICNYLDMGVTNIINGEELQGKYSINTAVIRQAITNGKENIDEILQKIAEEWVGKHLANKLIKAWSLADIAAREQPMLGASGHALHLREHENKMPLVPDDSLLTESDLDYYMDIVLKDAEKLVCSAGGVWRDFYYEQETTMAYIKQYEDVCLPAYEKSLTLVLGCLEHDKLNQKAKECLEEQKQLLENHLKTQHLLLSWLQAAMYKLKHLTVPDNFIKFTDIIEKQMQLIDNPERSALMQAHRQDKLKEIDLSSYPANYHLGLAPYEKFSNIRNK